MKAKYWWETNSVEVPRGKDAKNLEKRDKELLDNSITVMIVSESIGVI